MAFLLADAAKLTQDMLLRGIIETIITESRVLRYLPFLTVMGSGVTYNQELTLGTADWHAPNGAWTADEPTIQQQTVALKILGGDADVDRFIAQTYSNINDIKAAVIEKKAKATAYAFNDAFFNGDSGSDPNQFDGLYVQAGVPATALTGYTGTVRVASNGANGATLTLADLDTMIDAVKPGKPDALFMSKRSRRKITALMRAAGSGVLQTGIDSFGRQVMLYNDIPLEIDENIADTYTVGASGAVCSRIYAVKFGYLTGVGGLQNGGITREDVGTLETKDATRTRIKWYCGIAVYRPISYAILQGVKE